MKIKLAFLFLVVLSRADAMENEVWISPLAGNAVMDGTPGNPFRCPDARSLSRLMASTLTNSGLVLHFMAGQFEVANPGLLVRPGWRVHGSGINTTIIRMRTNAAPRVSATVFYADAAEGAEISDLTIDCNYQNQTNPVQVAAISLTGSNVRISRVKAINWGTSGPENFVIDISNDGVHSTFNDVIEDCVVTQPAPVLFGGGVSALSIFTDVGGSSSIQGAVYRNNFVYGVRSGTGGIGCPQYFHAYGAGGMVCNNFAGDLTGPGSCGIYRDTWDGRDVVIEGNVFDNVTHCIYFNMEQAHMTGVVIQNNVLRPAEGGMGINYYTGPNKSNTNAYVRDLILKGNVIYPSAKATNSGALVLDTRRQATVLDNVLQGGGTSATSLIFGTNTVIGNQHLSRPWHPTNRD